MEKKIIDVSKYQKVIDWDAVKPNIDGAIIRCGYGSDISNQDDWKWERNADECTRLGIPFGVYLYSYAKNTEMAKSEAQHILRLVKGYDLSYPIYIDLEQSGCESAAVEVGKTIGDIIEAAGYCFGVYANEYWFKNYIGSDLDKYTKWCAKYSSSKPEIPGNTYDMWQYSSKESVAGIDGTVDMSICYRDFVGEIKGSEYVESTPVEAPEPAKKSEDEVAMEIYKGIGNWGDGQTRKDKLRAAGYDPESVQAKVNALCAPEPAKKSEDEVAMEIYKGIDDWGTGQDRVNKLTAAGYNANSVQAKVNALCGVKSTPKPTPAPAPTPKPVSNGSEQFEEGHRNGTRFHTTTHLNIRNNAGTEGTKVLATLPTRTEAIWYGYYRVVNGTRWYKVVANGVTGWVSGDYIS